MKDKICSNSPFQILLSSLPQAQAYLDKFNGAPFWFRQSEGRIQARYVSPFAIILHKEGVYPKIGKGTWIGHFCILDGSQGLEIGEGCDISCGVQIYTHSTALRCAKGKEKLVGSVKIGDHVFIGPNSIISYDCEIADREIIMPLTYMPPHTRRKTHE